MKKILYILFMLASLSAMAASHMSKAYILNFKDGSKQIFYTDWVDSIRVSTIGTDSVDYKAPVCQEFWIQGEVYRYNLEDIDSIVFRIPQTELQPNVIDIEQNLFDYIVGFDQDAFVLRFSTDLPEQLIPNPGTRLVCRRQSEILPVGFIGEVKSIEKDSLAGASLHCSRVELTDIFKTYYSTENVSDAYTQQPIISRSPQNERLYESGMFRWHPDKPFSKSASMYVDSDPLTPFFDFDSLIESDQKVGVKIEESVHPDITIRPTLIVENGVIYANILGQGSIDYSFAFALYGRISNELKIPLIAGDEPLPIPNCPFLTCYYDLGLFCQAAIEAGFEFKDNTRYNLNFMINYGYTAEGSDIPLKNFFSLKEDIKARNTNSSGSYVKGHLSLGGYGEIGIGLINHRLLKVGGRAEIGSRFECNVHVPLIPSPSNKVPDSWQFPYLKDGGIESSLFFSSSLIAESLESDGVEIPISDAILKGSVYPFVPDFDNLEVVRSKHHSNMAVASFDVDGKLCRGWSIGVVAYDDNSQLVERNYYPAKYSGWNNDEKSFEVPLVSMPIYKNVNIYPAIQAGEKDLIAGAPVVLRRLLNPITTPPAKVAETEAQLRGRIEGFYSEHLDGVDTEYEFEIMALNEDSISYSVPAILNISEEDPSIAEVHANAESLDPETEYSYRIVASVTDSISTNRIDGEYVSFTTLKEKQIIETCNGHHFIDKATEELPSAYESKYGLNLVYAPGLYESADELFNSPDRVTTSRFIMTNGHDYRVMDNLLPDTIYTYTLQGINADQTKPDLYTYSGLNYIHTANDSVERAALLHLYDIGDGPNWANQKNWGSKVGVCNWENYNPHIGGQLIIDPNYNGPIELKGLNRLGSIDIPDNFSGSISDILLEHCSNTYDDSKDLGYYYPRLDYQFRIPDLENVNLTVKDCDYSMGLKWSPSSKHAAIDLNILSSYLGNYGETYISDANGLEEISISYHNDKDLSHHYHEQQPIILDVRGAVSIQNTNHFFRFNTAPASIMIDSLYLSIESAPNRAYPAINFPESNITIANSTIGDIDLAGGNVDITDCHIEYSVTLSGGVCSLNDCKVGKIIVNNGATINLDNSLFGTEAIEPISGDGILIINNSMYKGYYIGSFKGTPNDLLNYIDSLNN
jgi:hypothetical protein